jgi:hypothetical protein
MRIFIPGLAAGRAERLIPKRIDYLISGSSVSALMRIWSV